MKSLNSVISDPKSRPCLCSLFVTASLICSVYFIGSAWFGKDSFRILPTFGAIGSRTYPEYKNCKVESSVDIKVNNTKESIQPNKCEVKCRPFGGEALPKGIVSATSNLEMRPLWGPVSENESSSHAKNLLAIAVGIKQKELVNQIVEKFLENDFVVMLFHYDGVVDEWNDFNWYRRVIHVSATNQTKWWFAKRFLHPDIVAEYEYIFLWDEDLEVENFNPGRYLSIVKEEDLEISQPALDRGKSEVHHHITARWKRSRVHRRYYKLKGSGRCDDDSTAPPCVGWVEMMAPVFSRAAWRCAWYMVQNDLIHAWGLDMQLGYCSQGDRMRKVGVVDAEYLVHLGLPTLGGLSGGDKLTYNATSDRFSQLKNLTDSEEPVTSVPYKFDNRYAVRRQSYIEMKIFRSRWNKAVNEDTCWVDIYSPPPGQKRASEVGLR